MHHCNETHQEHDGVAILKEKISTDQQSILIEADVPTVSAKKGQPEATPDHVSDTVPDNRTRCSCQYNDDDVDLTSGGGKECSGNKDCLSGERHAGTFQRNNTKDDPRAVDWDQANQSIGQRSKLHLLRQHTSRGQIWPIRAASPGGAWRSMRSSKMSDIAAL